MHVSLETWAAFSAAAAVLIVIPGPTVMLVVSYALAAGRSVAPALVAGVALGDMVAVTLSFAGLGAVLAASAALFSAVKWAGAAYLVYLGVRMWVAPAKAPDTAPDVPVPVIADPRDARTSNDVYKHIESVPLSRFANSPKTVRGASTRRMFGHAFAVTALNPKGMVFFVAFVPQFLDSSTPLLPQMALLGATFIALGASNVAAYAWLAGGAGRARLRPRAFKLANRLGGGVLIAAGVLAARQN